MKILAIIPAYNESENIETVVDNLQLNYPYLDYVVVNDGSKDSTAEICRSREYNFIDLPINIGLAGAVQTGMKYASNRHYDAAVQLDGDGQHDPEYIKDMLSLMLETGADIVIGSRFVAKKKGHSARMLGSNILQFLIRLTTGAKIKDPTSGMRLFDKETIHEFAWNMNYGPEPDTLAYLIRNGARIVECQVEMKERLAGESYLNFSRSITYMAHMCMSIILLQWFRKRRV